MTQSTARVIAPRAALTCRGIWSEGMRASKASTASCSIDSASTLALSSLTASCVAYSGNWYRRASTGEDE